MDRQDLDGIDLTPVLLDDQELPRELYWNTGRGAAFRRGPWKYIKNRGGPEMLFDIRNDPAEQRSVITERPRLAADLRARHATIMRGLSEQ